MYNFTASNNKVVLSLCGRLLFSDGFDTQQAVYVSYPKLLILMPHTYVHGYIVLLYFKALFCPSVSR